MGFGLGIQASGRGFGLLTISFLGVGSVLASFHNTR